MSLKLVKRIKLKADDPTEQRVLDYLNENASEVLAEKINAGKKTIAGALEYAKGEARSLAVNGCACIEDATVFGWVIHFFEEDDIKEPKKGAATRTARTAGKARAAKKGPAKAGTTNGKKKPGKKSADDLPGSMFLELFNPAAVASTKPEAV